ncbi:MAG: hypothetical protein EHM41_22495, partial [Chloroflexi bacterium]
MPEQLLATKFFIPPIRTGLVSRPRLMKTLENALRLPLSIITAPPGFGKTTLITEWLQSVQKSQSTPPHCIAWVSLDPDDNTISRFWKYAITSLQKAAVSAAVPSETGEVLSEVQGMLATSITPYQVFLTQLINEVSGLPFTFILILDDYHVILEPAISESLTYFIDHIPPNLHLILASRTDPPIPTGRWRARGQMIHLRTQDLRFLMEEVTQFFNDSIGLNLSPENVAVLDQRTEGWAAGLQMAAIVLQDKDEMEIANSISAFTGRHHMLLDYFTEEVLSRQPDEVQHFLLQTSVLDRMCAELCAALNDTGLTATSSITTIQAQAMLERLERGNLFVIPLDSERQWYRYHHLFNDLLLTRLRQTIGQQGEAELRRRAAHWHNQHGHLSEAVRMALQAQDFDLAASLIENPAQSIR